MHKIKDENYQDFVNQETISEQEFDLVMEYLRIRYDSHISQRDLANKTGLAQSTIARLEKNLHSASLATFIKILSSLGYHLEIKKD